MKMTLSSRMTEARAAAGFTQAELARRVGCSQAAIASIENGRNKGSALLAQIADAVGVSALWLSTGTGPKHPGAVARDGAAFGGPHVRQIPILDGAQVSRLAGTDAEFDGQAKGYTVSDTVLSEHAFAFEIEGASMLPEFKPGDRIIVDRERAPSPGALVVALDGGGEATFRKYRPKGIGPGGADVFELVPLNEDFPTLYSDRQSLVVVGTMVEHRRYYK